MTRIPQGALAAALKYGPSVNAIAQQYTNPLTGKPLSGSALLLKLSSGENAFQMGGQPSSAGARGATQFTPGSRQVAIQKFGIDPWSSYDAAFHAAALHLRGKINGSTGLAGYNPGSSSYTNYILGQRVGNVGAGRSGGSSSAARPSSQQVSVSVPGQQQGSTFDPGGGTDNTGLISALLQQQQAPAYAPSAQVPSYSAARYLKSAGNTPQIVPQAPQTSSSDLLGLLGQADFSLPQDQQTQGQGVTVTGKIPNPNNAGASHPGHASHGGLATFDGKQVASWIAPVLQYARQQGWKGTVTSGYRSDAQQKRIYDSGVRPAARPVSEGGGGSNHSRLGFLQGAIDVTDAGTLNQILQRKHSRLQYAGAKDPVHFSVPRNGTY